MRLDKENIAMPPELQAFYNAYALWLNDGAPEIHDRKRVGIHKVLIVTTTFTRDVGLCCNFRRYAMDQGMHDWQALAVEMSDQFERELFPFGGPHKYDDEARRNVLHLNAERRAWVHKHSQIPVLGED
jgi:hypothetical protein